MLRRHFLTLSASGLLAACAAGPRQLKLAPGSTLIVVRHGDRDGEDLNAKGRERARALVTALDGMDLHGIYSPGIPRNLDTAAPLSAARNLPVNRIATLQGPCIRNVSSGAAAGRQLSASR